MKFFAVDFNSVFRRMWEAAEGKEFSQARQRTVSAIQEAAHGYDRIVVCRDAGVSFRRGLYAGYKAKRPDPGEAFREQLKMALADMRELGATVWASPSLGRHETLGDLYGEADDVIASFALWYQEQAPAQDPPWYLRIMTGDCDLWALVDDQMGIDVLTLERKIITANEVAERFHVAPYLVPEVKALMGDDSDDYRFFKGIGDVTAAAIVNATVERQEGERVSSDAVFRAALAGAEDPGVKLKSNVVEVIKAGGLAALNLARQLATLRNTLRRTADRWEPIDFSSVLGEPVRVPRKSDPAYEVKPKPPTETAVSPPTAELATRPVASAAMELRRETTIASPRDGLPFIGELEKSMTFAGEMYRSGLFRNLSNPAACLMLIEHARAFGVPAVIAGQYAYEVNGKLSFMAQLMMSVVIRHPSTIRFRFDLPRCNAERAVLLYGRRFADGDSIGEYEFTLEMAEEAGYTTGKNAATWKKQRRSMLRWAAARECARALWPEVTIGLRSPDEVRDGEIGDDGTFPEEMLAEAA